MSGGRADLVALAQLAGAAFAGEQAKLSALKARETQLRDKLAALDADRGARAQASGAGDPAFWAGADLLWHGWIDTRRTALNADLARTLAAQDIAKAALARAFGRRQATEKLVELSNTDRARARARRSERDTFL